MDEKLITMKNFLRNILHYYWFARNKTGALFGKNAKQIIICGYPRSGTSLLYNMISTSIKGFHCEPFEMEGIRRLHRSGNYVTKYPLDILSINELINNNKLDKKLYFIIVTRDIRDVITSRHPNLPDQYFIGYKHSWWPQDKNFSHWKYDAPGIEDIYSAITRYKNLNYINVMEIKYENLVKDPNKVQEQIKKFADVEFSGLFQDFYKRSDKHAYKYTGRFQAKDDTLVRENKQIDISRIAKWKNREHAEIIREQFSKYPELFDILINEGYEKDRDWFQEIDKS